MRTGRIPDIGLTNRSGSAARLLPATLVVAVLLGACNRVGGIDYSQIAAVSNNDTYATVADIWAGAQAAITARLEPLTGTFTLALNYAVVCPSGGQRSYQGTLTGTNTNGTGSAALALTGSLTKCAFGDTFKTTTITASGVTITGTIAITNDAYAATSVHLVATGVTVNDVVCAGGIDMTLTALAPSSQATAAGTACGRTGSVPLP